MSNKRSLPKWREDFPVGWDDDHHVTRRDLAKFLTLGSALVVGANLGLAFGVHRRQSVTHEAKRIASASSLVPGSSILFRYPTESDPCILIRTRSGALAAFSQVCTHLSCAVVYRADDDRIHCPCHEGVFDCGKNGGGARPLAGPPERPLPRVSIDVRGDDVYATGVEV